MAGKDFGLTPKKLTRGPAFRVGNCVLIARGPIAGLTGVVSAAARNRRFVVTVEGWPAGVVVVIGTHALKRRVSH